MVQALTNTLPVGHHTNVLTVAGVAAPQVNNVIPSDANQLAYTPGNSSFWKVPAPVTIEEALNQRAVPCDHEQANLVPYTGIVNVVTEGIASFSCLKSGRFLVVVNVNFSTSAADNIAIRFKADAGGGSEQSLLDQIVSRGINLLNVSTFSFFVVLNRTLNHTMQLQLETANALTAITVPTGGIHVSWLELA